MTELTRIKDLLKLLKDIDKERAKEIKQLNTRYGNNSRELLEDLAELLPDEFFDRIEGLDCWGDKVLTIEGKILGEFWVDDIGTHYLVVLKDSRKIVVFDEKRVGVLSLDEPMQITEEHIEHRDLTKEEIAEIYAEVCHQFIKNHFDHLTKY